MTSNDNVALYDADRSGHMEMIVKLFGAGAQTPEFEHVRDEMSNYWPSGARDNFDQDLPLNFNANDGFDYGDDPQAFLQI